MLTTDGWTESPEEFNHLAGFRDDTLQCTLDPQELQNVYEDRSYADIRYGLHRALDSLQLQYKDNPEYYLKALQPARRKHKGLKATYHFQTPPEKPHQGQALTDGLYQPFSIYNATVFNGYAAFRLQPMELVVDLGRRRRLREVALHCLQLPGNWIYFPASLEIQHSRDGEQFTRSAQTTFATANDTVPGDHWFRLSLPRVRARYVKILAEEVKTIPNGLPGAGARARLFCDEITMD